jgi:hypothetical protein
MIKPRDNLRPQSSARSVWAFLAITLGSIGIISTWRLFSIGAAVLPTILGGILCGLLYVLADRIWRREGEYLKRYTNVDDPVPENPASGSNLRVVTHFDLAGG